MLFKRCRRAWDFGAGRRQNLERIEPAPLFDFAQAIRDALAVYYFPGMWDWDRAIVRPLALAAFTRAMQGQREECLRSRRPSAEEERVWSSRFEEGEATLRRYFDWAPAVDRFVPIRVDTEFDVPVPDPENPGVDVVTPDGDPVHFRGRVDLLVEDRSGGYWIVDHRIDASGFAEAADLRLDERAVTDCWAWESFFLGMPIAGNVANEIPRSGVDEVVWADWRFRRTHVRRSRFELGQAGQRLAREIRVMTDPGLSPYPSPAPENCGRCAFVPPCLAMNEGSDPAPILAGDYRRRVAPPAEEPRIGRTTWAMSRGATVLPPFGNDS